MAHEAIYVRTSTTDQDGQAQLHALRTAAGARGWTDARELMDIGHSGAKASRPALDDLRRLAQRGEVRVVMVAALDRLGRSLRDLLVLLDELTAAGCAVVSLREGIDLGTPAGRLLVHMIGALAEFEREIIRERVKAGVAAARRRGRVLGRPVRRLDVERAKDLRAGGASWSAVAEEVGVPASTVRDALACENPRRWTPATQRG